MSFTMFSLARRSAASSREYVSAYGVLLDPAIDTSAAFSNGSVTGSIAKAGSFKGSALIVSAGVDAGLISVALRGKGIFIEGPLNVPVAQALEIEAEKPAPTGNA